MESYLAVILAIINAVIWCVVMFYVVRDGSNSLKRTGKILNVVCKLKTEVDVLKAEIVRLKNKNPHFYKTKGK